MLTQEQEIPPVPVTTRVMLQGWDRAVPSSWEGTHHCSLFIPFHVPGT